MLKRVILRLISWQIIFLLITMEPRYTTFVHNMEWIVAGCNFWSSGNIYFVLPSLTVRSISPDWLSGSSNILFSTSHDVYVAGVRKQLDTFPQNTFPDVVEEVPETSDGKKMIWPCLPINWRSWWSCSTSFCTDITALHFFKNATF